MRHLPIDRNHETGHQKPKHVNMHSGQVGKVKIQGQQRREHALVARIQRKGSRRCEIGYNARCARTQQFHTRLPTTSAPLMILGTIDGVPSSKREASASMDDANRTRGCAKHDRSNSQAACCKIEARDENPVSPATDPRDTPKYIVEPSKERAELA